MKVKDFEVAGFGVWKGLEVEQVSEGLTVFCGYNEAGKSIVCLGFGLRPTHFAVLGALPLAALTLLFAG